ncbi:MAG: hypothetical protein DRN11_04600 [Thermoplasmata archaeon]|nr:MAG: hypothetical protein DRN11_04600 [Thermoplasmata archaeon]
MVKTKTTDFIIRYFVRLFNPIIAERWKDLRIEGKIERLLRDCFNVLYINEINFSSFSVMTLSLAYYFTEKAGFL